jgi:hypothetical protein
MTPAIPADDMDRLWYLGDLFDAAKDRTAQKREAAPVGKRIERIRREP